MSRPVLLALAWLGATPAAQAGQSHAPSILPVTLTLDQERYGALVNRALHGQVGDGEARGELYAGAVAYRLSWHAELSKASSGWRPWGEGVLLELRLPLELNPRFELRKGAGKTYKRVGCGRTTASLRFSASLTRDGDAAILTNQPLKVDFAKGYRCVYQRNLLGSVVAIVKKEMLERVDVVPLLRSGISARIGALQTAFFAALSARIGSGPLQRELSSQLARPRELSPNMWLSGDLHEIRFESIGVNGDGLVLKGKAQALPKIAFGHTPPAPSSGSVDIQPGEDGFRLPFDLIIPRGPIVYGPSTTWKGQPGYGFRALDRPGVAALTQVSAERVEDVILVSGGADQAALQRLPMEGPINGVLNEIIDWLENNPGVQGESSANVDQLLAEVRRVASLVRYFQRPRSIELGLVGQLTLSNLSIDLQWIALGTQTVRAGVLLKGDASVYIAL